MKRLSTFFLGLLLSATFLQAQDSLYVCEGYDYERVPLQGKTAFVYSSDGTSVTIGDETFVLADIDSITLARPQYPAVRIHWSGTTASVQVDPRVKGVSYTISGAYVSVTSTNETDEILYELSGQSSDGGLLLTGSYKLRIDLNGVSLTSSKGAPFDIECGKRVEVKLTKGTVNTFADASSNTVKGAFYVKGHLEVKGGGTLNVTGNARHALAVGEYLQFKPSTGTVNILGAASDGIHCGKGKVNSEHSRLLISGGEINVANCANDCIDADDYGSVFIDGGALNLHVSQQNGDGLKCDSILYMSGGTIDVDVTGDLAHGVRVNYSAYLSGGTIQGAVSGTGAKGFRSKQNTLSTSNLVANGGDAYFQGTNITLKASGGVSPTDGSKCMGIRIDRNLTQTAGTVLVDVTNTAAIGVQVKGTSTLTGGTISPQPVK
jgi:hypothetical protein